MPLLQTVQLLPFQREGVSWMAHQEEHSVFRGGILADEMGMYVACTRACLRHQPSSACCRLLTFPRQITPRRRIVLLP